MSSVEPLYQLVLYQLTHQGQYAAISPFRLNLKGLLELAANLLQRQSSFEALPNPGPGGIEAVVCCALEMEEDGLSRVQLRVNHFRVWVYLPISTDHRSSLQKSWPDMARRLAPCMRGSWAHPGTPLPACRPGKEVASYHYMRL
jgi:hypothetical protein